VRISEPVEDSEEGRRRDGDLGSASWVVEETESVAY